VHVFRIWTTVSVLHDAQLLLNKQQQIWGGVYILLYIDIFRAVPTVVLGMGIW